MEVIGEIVGKGGVVYGGWVRWDGVWVRERSLKITVDEEKLVKGIEK